MILKDKINKIFKLGKTKTKPKKKAKGPLKSGVKDGDPSSHLESRGTVLKVLPPT